MQCRPFLLAALVLAPGLTARAEPRTEIRAILNRAIRATGGEARLSQLKAGKWTVRGKYYETQIPTEFVGEWARESPDRLRAVLRGQSNDSKFEMITVFNHDVGWISVNGKGHPMSADEIAETKDELHASELARLTPLRGRAVSLTLLGPAKVEGRAAVGIKAVARERRDVKLFFDTENGLLIKTETTVKDDRTGKEVTQETVYSDHRDVDGLKLPFKTFVRRNGKPYLDSTVSDYKASALLEPALFEKP
jgi:hypothetical protein